MQKLLIAAFSTLLFAGVLDSVSAQGAPGAGATIYDFPPPYGSLPRGTRGFYLRKFGTPDCPKGIYWGSACEQQSIHPELPMSYYDVRAVVPVGAERQVVARGDVVRNVRVGEAGDAIDGNV